MAIIVGDRAVEQLPVAYAERTVTRRFGPVLCEATLVASDCFAFFVTAAAVFGARKLLFGDLLRSAFPGTGSLMFDLGTLFAGVAIWLAWNGRYRDRLAFAPELRLLVSTCFFVGLMLAALQLLSGGILRCGALIVVMLMFPAVATVARGSAKRLLDRIGAWALPIIVVGTGPHAAAAEAALISDGSLGYRIVRRVDPAAMIDNPASPTWKSVLHRYGARRLLVALGGDGQQQRHVVELLLRERVPFALLPQPSALPAFSHEVTQFFSHDAMLVSYRDGLSQPLPRVVKATADVVVAAILLVVLLPVFLAIAVVTRIEDGGPALFAHRRVGAGGRPFHCLKFRTMVVDADKVLAEALARDAALSAEWTSTRKLRNDPRVTKVGQFLRKTSLDELPQLINIVRLEMSLVGPRPIVDSEVALYGKNIAHYYSTRPGLTGLWQVSGRSNTSFARRVQLDVWYVNNWALWSDFVVLLKTVPAVLAREGAH